MLFGKRLPAAARLVEAEFLDTAKSPGAEIHVINDHTRHRDERGPPTTRRAFRRGSFDFIRHDYEAAKPPITSPSDYAVPLFAVNPCPREYHPVLSDGTHQ